MIGGLARKSSFYVLVIMIWEVASRVGFWPRFLFPAPSEVLQTLLQGFADRTFIFGILASLRRILLGYSISLVAGVLLGLGISRNKFIAETIGSLILGLQTLPSICWLPLALLWFGLNESAIIFVVVMGALLVDYHGNREWDQECATAVDQGRTEHGSQGPTIAF